MVKKSEQKILIGDYIRKKVLPDGLSVKKAAGLLDVSRPTLSNLLNGNASLSQEMAQKLERAFGVSARELIELQTSHEALAAAQIGVPEKTKRYVPPFLKIVANDIEEWAGHSNISARSRFAVLLRILVQSTNTTLTMVDFPGNDDSQRHGWDGLTVASSGSPWVPSGNTGWEFGVNQNPKSKADKDYKKSLKLPKGERLKTTFIFVTPRRWPGKGSWRDERLKEGNWKDIRVYDASDIEQWLEQSIPAQAWFANESNMPSSGVLSLDTCWRNWSMCCNPPLLQSLFQESLASANIDAIAKKIENGTLVVAADSREEGLAFLSVLFEQDHPLLAALRDRIAVFTEPGVLPRLMQKGSVVIPVIINQEIEKEHAILDHCPPSIVVRPKNIAGSDADVSLETLSHKALHDALAEMGLNEDEIELLVHESGQSLTVLRRRLAKADAIKIPSWSSDSRHTRLLIPMAFAGSWDTRTSADKDILVWISEAENYDAIDQNILALMDIEDPPVWMLGSFRGVVSKLDALFAIKNSISEADLARFFEVAALVLSEDDPALDLPEDERWMANIYGKKREISGALREGISETLVILSVYGKDLFGDRLGFNPSDRIAGIIRNLLADGKGRAFEAHSHDLPMYAEAAPETFLEILEEDLDAADPAVFEIIRPMSSSLFGSSPRTGLLWALEILAWHPERLTRVVAILARLATKPLDDNLANKPTATLSAIFRSWMPQTAANVDERIAALDYLVNVSPQLGWSICIEQLEPGSRFGCFNQKPRWRTDARGAGQAISRQEVFSFNRHALDLALKWPNHSERTLGDLVKCLEVMLEEDQEMVWSLISTWAETADDTEKAVLRERIRTTTKTRRAKKKMRRDDIPQLSKELMEMAKDTFDKLKPKDIVQRHSWLFLNSWVDVSADELEDDDGWEKQEAQIARLRMEAVEEVYTEHAIEGLINLAATGEASYSVGWCAANIITTENMVLLIEELVERSGFQSFGVERGLVAGLFANLKPKTLRTVLETAHKTINPERFVSLLTLAPFTSNTWRVAEDLGDEVEKKYWSEVPVHLGRLSGDDREHGIHKLLEAGRPRATFQLVRFDFENISTNLLFRILDEAAASEENFQVNQMEAYAIKEAFKVLNEKLGIPVSDMATLEFRYLSVFDREEGAIPNLEKQISENPEMFAQAVAHLYKRSDDKEDPQEFQAQNVEVATARAKQAFKLLNLIRRIPGGNRGGEIDSTALVDWINSARSSLRELGRIDVGDTQIGEILARSEVGKDGVWPCEAVREAMEKVLNQRIAEGFRIGKLNQRGVHWRGEGGQQERELAAEYDKWAQSLNSSHPRTARTLRKLRDSYLRDGEWQDTEAKIKKRLRH